MSPRVPGTSFILDVNVLVACVRADHQCHRAAQDFVRGLLRQENRILVPIEVAAAALRVLTMSFWIEPESSASAALLIGDWLDAADARLVSHPVDAWRFVSQFARTMDLAPRALPDALLAASAISMRATLVSFDRGLARFPGLTAAILSPVPGSSA